VDIGPNTEVNSTLRTWFLVIAFTATCVLGWTHLATKAELVKTKTDLQAQITSQKERDAKLDTAIQLLQQADENHDKHLEAFTRALERLRP